MGTTLVAVFDNEEKRIFAAKADFNVRSKKFNQAWKIIRSRSPRSAT